MKAADHTLGVHPAALAVLNILASRELAFMAIDDIARNRLETFGWYDGDRGGFSLVYSRYGCKAGHIIVVTARPDSTIDASSWSVEQRPYAAPGPSDVPDAPRRRYYATTSAGILSVVEFVMTELQGAYLRALEAESR